MADPCKTPVESVPRGVAAGMHSLLRMARAAAVAIGLGTAATVAIAPLAPVAHAQSNERYAAFVVDASSGRVLFSKNADALRYPASLTKIMTAYVLFEELSAGRLTMDTQLRVSAHAAAQAPSKLGVKAGSTVSVRDAMLALMTRSANDCAVVIAENISGSEPAFARRMTATARRLGMRNTSYQNANGLPNPGQITTARDLAILGLAIQRQFPTYYRYFSTRSFRYKGQTITNHNRLMSQMAGIDGIKTGYIRASGFNLVSSIKRGNKRLVAVVMGGTSARARDQHMAELLNRYLPDAQPMQRDVVVAGLQGSRGDVGTAPAPAVLATGTPLKLGRPQLAEVSADPDDKVAMAKVAAAKATETPLVAETGAAPKAAPSVPALPSPAERPEPAAAVVARADDAGETDDKVPSVPVLPAASPERPGTDEGETDTADAAGDEDAAPAAKVPAAEVPAASVPAVRPRTAPAAVAAAEPAVPVTAYADDGNAALDAIGALTAGAQPAAKPAAAATAATDEAGGDQRRVKVLTIANPVINTAQAAEAAPAPAPKAAARTAVTAADAAYANDPIATQVAAAEAANARAASTQFAGTPFQDGAFNPDAVRKLIETRRVMVASAAQATVPAAGAVTSDAAPADNDAADAGEEAPAPARKKAAASRREPAGWQIQIGAVPTSKAAASFLAEARKKGGRALAGAEPYTEAVSKGGSTLYRARFSGFGSEKEAQQACAQLKKQSYACMAFRK